MYSYKVIKSQDTDFFSAPRYDGISTALIKDGDVVCVCGSCEELFLESSWKANNKRCCKCGCTSRKDINKDYFKKYRVNVKKITNTRGNHAPVSKRRRVDPVPVVNQSVQQPVQVVRRPRINTSVSNNTIELDELIRNYGSGSSAGSNRVNTSTPVNIPSSPVTTHPYPDYRQHRKIISRVLLAIVLILLVMAVAVGILFVLDSNGSIDLSALQSDVEAMLEENGVAEQISTASKNVSDALKSAESALEEMIY